MKVRSKRHLREEPDENLEDFVGLVPIYMYDHYEDDLYDVGEEISTSEQNKIRKFECRIPPNEYDKLSDEEKRAYHQFLIDSIKE